ncbi:bacteriophage protein [Shigella flexneri 2a]|nr:bacteriophage protein [Shigella flexneri 2a]
MVDLRKAARGQMCTVRIPGYCNHNPETSVLAHYRLAGTCGTATKPHDMQVAIACSSCHDLIDGRVKTSDLKWSTKTGHRVRVFPVSIFRFVWG